MSRRAAAIAALFFTNGAAFASWAPRIPEVADKVGVDVAGLGLTLMFGGIGGLVGTQPAGWAIDRFGSRRVAVAGALVIAFGLPVLGLATVPAVLAVGVFVLGAADVSADIGMNAQAMIVQQGRSSLINRFHALWSIGTVVGGILGSAAAGAGMALEVHFTIVAVVLAGVVIASNRQLTDETIASPSTAQEGGRASALRPLIVLGVLGLLAAFVEAPGAEWSATFMDVVYEASPAIAGLGFVAFTIGMTTTRLLGDGVTNRYGNRRSLMTSLLVAAGGWLIAAGPGPAVVALIGLGVAGLGAGMIFPQLYAAGGAGTIVSQGRGLSAMSLGSRLGFLVATPSVGLAGAAFGLDVAIAGLVGLAAVAALTIVSLDRTVQA